MSYPPTYQESTRLFGELKELDELSESGFSPRKYEIIHDLAEAHFFEAKEYFISGLSNPDPDYRWACVSALATHWQAKDDPIVARLLEMAEHDPDIQVRMIAISSLGVLIVKDSKSILERILTTDTEESDIKKVAREALERL